MSALGTLILQWRAVNEIHFEILRALVLSQPAGTLRAPADGCAV